MVTMDVILDGEGAYSDIPADKIVDAGHIVSMAILPSATNSGNCAVCVRLNLPDGRVALAQTTLKILQQAMVDIEKRYGKATGKLERFEHIVKRSSPETEN